MFAREIVYFVVAVRDDFTEAVGGGREQRTVLAGGMHSPCPPCVRAALPNDGVVQSEPFRAGSRARPRRGVSPRPRKGVASGTNSPRGRVWRVGG